MIWCLAVYENPKKRGKNNNHVSNYIIIEMLGLFLTLLNAYYCFSVVFIFIFHTVNSSFAWYAVSFGLSLGHCSQYISL